MDAFVQMIAADLPAECRAALEQLLVGSKEHVVAPERPQPAQGIVRVRLTGLKAVELNGQVGVRGESDAVTQRWAVQLDSGRTVSVRSRAAVIPPPPPPSGCGIATESAMPTKARE
jgi:hypothetical protein